MPKLIVTKASLPKILLVLDRWEGKLTWPLFCAKVAKVLHVEAVSRHTLMRYKGIQHRFKVRQQELRDAVDQEPRNYALEAANKRIRDLEAQRRRLEETNTLLLERFQRWQYNAYAHNLRQEQLDAALPEVDRAGRGEIRKRPGAT